MSNKGNFSRWWELVKTNDDWNSLPIDTKKQIARKVKLCFIDLNNLEIAEEDILALVEQTDVPTVFDAILRVWVLPTKNKRSKDAILSYLKTVVVNSWEEKHLIKFETIWHKETPRKEKIPISVEALRKYDLLRKNNYNH